MITLTDNSYSKKKTIFASILSVLLVIPCHLIGGIAVVFFVGSNYYDSIFFFSVAEILRGAVTGYAAIFLGTYIFSNCNKALAALSVALVWCTIWILLSVVNFSIHGFSKDLAAFLLYAGGMGFSAKLFATDN